MLKFTDFRKVAKLKKEAKSLLSEEPAQKYPQSGQWLRLVDILQKISGINAQLCALKMAKMNKKEILQLINEF
jgi:hypothetical protein